MKKFYKIISEQNKIFIMYDSETEEIVQVTNKNISFSRGVLFGWQDSNEKEFFENFYDVFYYGKSSFFLYYFFMVFIIKYYRLFNICWIWPTITTTS